MEYQEALRVLASRSQHDPALAAVLAQNLRMRSERDAFEEKLKTALKERAT